MPPAMTLKDALGFVIDYGKFIATLWNTFIVFTVAVIGWLVSLHKDGLGDPKKGLLFIAAYLVATGVFAFVLHANQKYFGDLHRMLHEIADIEPKDGAAAAYDRTLRKNNPGPMLDATLRYGLPTAAALASIIMIAVIFLGR